MKKYLLLFLLLCASAVSAQTIADKLTTINSIKLDIKAALASKSQTVGDDFSVYDDAVASISGSMFEIVATVNNAECGGTVTASQPAVICSPTTVPPWIPVATAPVAAAYPSGGPGWFDSAAMTPNGEYLAVMHNGTSAPKTLITYKWNEALNSFALTDDPTDPAYTGEGGAVAMSADGSKMAIISTSGTSENMQFYYWGTTGYLLGTEPADVTALEARGMEMNGDGSRLVVTTDASPYLACLLWSAASGTYVISTAPDALAGYGYSVAMDYSGSKLVANEWTQKKLKYYIWDGTKYTTTGATQPDVPDIDLSTGVDMSLDGKYVAVGLRASPWLVSYYWDTVDSRYEKMAAITGLNNNCNAVSIASDGRRILIGGAFTSPNYAAVLELDETLNKYILVQNAASAPGSEGKGVAISGDGNRIAVCTTGADYLRLYNVSSTYTGWYVYPLQSSGSMRLYPRYFGYAETSGSASDTVTFKAYWHQDEYTGFEE